MPDAIPGIHHVTAIGSDPGRNLAFYTDTLGLSLVKRSVNQDDASVYHLFYGDHSGTPGTSMTFFPYTNARPGRVGTGQISTTQFLIPDGSVDYWTDRLDAAGVDADEPRERFGDTVIPFRDPDGLPLELVARGDAPDGDPPEGPVPAEHAIRGSSA
jgi:glyoxalase family protein